MEKTNKLKKEVMVFLGDSNTAPYSYHNYCNIIKLHYGKKNKNVHFINKGRGGDTALGGLKRLKRDVFDQKATNVVVVFGINDIRWGRYIPGFQKYLDGIRDIIKQCQEHNVRVYISSYPSTGPYAQKIWGKGLDVARSLEADTIDITYTMGKLYKIINKPFHQADHIHLNQLGHHVVAYAILKELDLPDKSEAISSILSEIEKISRVQITNEDI